MASFSELNQARAWWLHNQPSSSFDARHVPSDREVVTAYRAHQRRSHYLPSVVMNRPELGMPDDIGARPWQPLPGSHLWHDGVPAYFVTHLRTAAPVLALGTFCFAFLATLLLLPVWWPW